MCMCGPWLSLLAVKIPYCTYQVSSFDFLHLRTLLANIIITIKATSYDARPPNYTASELINFFAVITHNDKGEE